MQTDSGADFVVRGSGTFTSINGLANNIRGTSFELGRNGFVQDTIAIGIGGAINLSDNIDTADNVIIDAQDITDIFTTDSFFDYIADPAGDITYNPEFVRPEVFEVEPAEQQVPEALREELLKLRIFARELLKGEKQEQRIKGYTYVPQIIVDKLAPISAYEVAINRISTEVAQEAVDFAKKLMGEDGENIETINKKISEAFEEYIEADVDGTPEGFAQYLLDPPSPLAEEAFEYVNSLDQLFKKIANMGITDTELSISRRNILSRLKVEGLRGREMIDFFESFVLAKETELSLSLN